MSINTTQAVEQKRTSRISDRDASATEQEWQALGLRPGTPEELDPARVVDVVIDYHFGLVDWGRGLYWTTPYHYVRQFTAGTSISKLVRGVLNGKCESLT